MKPIMIIGNLPKQIGHLSYLYHEFAIFLFAFSLGYRRLRATKKVDEVADFSVRVIVQDQQSRAFSHAGKIFQLRDI